MGEGGEVTVSVWLNYIINYKRSQALNCFQMSYACNYHDMETSKSQNSTPSTNSSQNGLTVPSTMVWNGQ